MQFMIAGGAEAGEEEGEHGWVLVAGYWVLGTGFWFQFDSTYWMKRLSFLPSSSMLSLMLCILYASHHPFWNFLSTFLHNIYLTMP